jgi:hypothetical protein
LVSRQRSRPSRSMCANTQSSRRCSCRKRGRSAPTATRVGSSTSMQRRRQGCDPADYISARPAEAPGVWERLRDLLRMLRCSVTQQRGSGLLSSRTIRRISASKTPATSSRTPDIAGCFSRVKSLYSIIPGEVLRRIESAQFANLMMEQEWVETRDDYRKSLPPSTSCSTRYGIFEN